MTGYRSYRSMQDTRYDDFKGIELPWQALSHVRMKDRCGRRDFVFIYAHKQCFFSNVLDKLSTEMKIKVASTSGSVGLVTPFSDHNVSKPIYDLCK